MPLLTLTHDHHYDRFQEILTQTRPDTMLEFFGGWGNMTERAVAVGVRNTLIDLDSTRAAALRARFPNVEVLEGNVFHVLPKLVKEGRTFDFVDVDNNSRSLRPTILRWRRSSFEHFDLVPHAFQLAKQYVRFCVIQETAGEAFLAHCNKTKVDAAILRMVRARVAFYGTDKPTVTEMFSAYHRVAMRYSKRLSILDWHPYNRSHGRLTLKIE